MKMKSFIMNLGNNSAKADKILPKALEGGLYPDPDPSTCSTSNTIVYFNVVQGKYYSECRARDIYNLYFQSIVVEHYKNGTVERRVEGGNNWAHRIMKRMDPEGSISDEKEMKSNFRKGKIICSSSHLVRCDDSFHHVTGQRKYLVSIYPLESIDRSSEHEIPAYDPADSRKSVLIFMTRKRERNVGFILNASLQSCIFVFHRQKFQVVKSFGEATRLFGMDVKQCIESVRMKAGVCLETVTWNERYKRIVVWYLTSCREKQGGGAAKRCFINQCSLKMLL